MDTPHARSFASSFFKNTGLGRHMDWKLPSNRLSFILPGIAVALAFGWDLLINDDLAYVESLRAGIAVFLAWAIAREIDPDRDWVAYAAMVLALALSIGHSPDLLVVGVALVGLRTLVGTVGRRLTVVDKVVLVSAAVFASLTPVGWGVAGVVVIAVRVSGGRWATVLSVLTLAASVSAALLFSDPIVQVQEAELGGYLPVVFVILALLLARVGYVRSRTDSGRRPLSVGRLRAARVAAALVVAFASAIEGLVGVALVGPVLAAGVPAAVAPSSDRR